ncbi:MAG TPA: type II toxin-antitoxin system HicA family toxin [Candidatus Paceibacterota bacterium]
MKRRTFLRHLHEAGCFLLREGKRHSVFYHPNTNRSSTVPRHREINNFLAEKICKDLDVPTIKNK